MKSEREIIDGLVWNKASEYAFDLQSRLDEFVLPSCESPIERMMAAALYMTNWPATDCYDLTRERSGYCHPHWCRKGTPIGDWEKTHATIPDIITDYMVIAPQQKLLSYRVDFLVLMASDEYGRHMAVVECDGHDFHERTKDQAKRDKLRDRELQALGHAVLRFTGSEVFKDATACAEQVAQHFWKIAQRHYSAKRAPFATQEHVA